MSNSASKSQERNERLGAGVPDPVADGDSGNDGIPVLIQACPRTSSTRVDGSRAAWDDNIWP